MFVIALMVVFIALTSFQPTIQAASNEEWKVIESKTTSDVNKPWTITLSKEVDATSVKANENVYVMTDLNEKKAVQTEVSGNTVKVIPSSSYETGKTYELFILDTVKSKKGTSLKTTKFKFSLNAEQGSADVKITKPGVYGGTSANPKVYTGDVYVESDGVSVKHAGITGNLIVTNAVGEGEVTLDTVTVKGET